MAGPGTPPASSPSSSLASTIIPSPLPSVASSMRPSPAVAPSPLESCPGCDYERQAGCSQALSPDAGCRGSMTAHHGRLGCAQHVSCTDVALDDAFGDGLYDDASPSPVAAKRALAPNAGGQPSPKRRQGLELAGATPRFGRSAVPFLIDGQSKQ